MCMKYWMSKMKSWNGYRQEAGEGGDGGGGGGGGGGEGGQGGKGDPDPKPEPKASISDAEAKLLKDVMKKKEALEAANKDLAAAKERLKEFDGIDPAQVKKLLADAAAAEEAKLAAAGEFDTLKKRMADEHGKKTGELEAAIAGLQAQLKSKDLVIDNLSVGQRFAQSPFIADETVLSSDMARKLYGEHFDVVDGSVVAYDKKRGVAGRAPLVDQLGNGVGFDEALRKILDADPDKDRVLKSKVKPGAGSSSQPVTKTPKQEDPKNGQDKIAAGIASLFNAK